MARDGDETREFRDESLDPANSESHEPSALELAPGRLSRLTIELNPRLATRLGRRAPGKQTRSQSRGIPGDLRGTLEQSLGTSLAAVQVHSGPVAEGLAESRDARAFAIGNDIVLGKDALSGEGGRFMMAHEVAHVVQQGGVTPTQSAQRGGGDHESQADMMASAMLAGKPVGAPAQLAPRSVQTWNRREEQNRQRWGAQPLNTMGENDEGIEPAIAANRALGFTPGNVGVLRRCLGLAQGAAIIERRFVEAVQRIQAGGSVQSLDQSAHGSDGNRAMGDSSQSGVIDLETIMRLEFLARMSQRHDRRQFYRNNRLWTRMSAEQFAQVQSQLITTLGVSAGDIRRVENRRGSHVVVTDNLLNRAGLWQLWTYRSESVRFGVLRERHLADMGIAIEVPSRQLPAEQEEQEEETREGTGGGGEEQREAGQETSTEDDVVEQQEEQEEEPEELTPEQIRERIDDAKRRVRRAARRPDALEQFEAIREEIERLNLPRTNFERSRRYTRVGAQAGRLIAELEYIADEEAVPAGDRRRAERAARRQAVPAEQSALVRHSRTEALGNLRDQGIVVAEGEDAARTPDGWEGRVLGQRAGTTADPAEVRRRGNRNARTFRALKGHLEEYQADLLASIRSGVIDRIYGSLEDIFDADFGQTNWTPPHSERNQRLRRAWNPGQRPPNTMPSEEGRQRQLANRWLRWLNSAIRSLGDDTQGEIHRNQQYADTDPTTITVEDPIQVDYHATGVTVCNNFGNPLPVSGMRLNVHFADAFLRFLRELQGLGVSEIWTSGFYREPISPADTHPTGRACDITGFVVGGVTLHLRSGQPRRRPDESDSAAMAEYNAIRGGHSDWFDHDDPPIGGQTHEQIMHGITNRMRAHFSAIVGPGNDRSHMGHWHVELTGGGRRGAQVHAQHLDDSQNPADTARWDRTQPGWRTAPEDERHGDAPPPESD